MEHGSIIIFIWNLFFFPPQKKVVHLQLDLHLFPELFGGDARTRKIRPKSRPTIPHAAGVPGIHAAKIGRVVRRFKIHAVPQKKGLAQGIWTVSSRGVKNPWILLKWHPMTSGWFDFPGYTPVRQALGNSLISDLAQLTGGSTLRLVTSHFFFKFNVAVAVSIKNRDVIWFTQWRIYDKNGFGPKLWSLTYWHNLTHGENDGEFVSNPWILVFHV